jgi:hypothetical protein
MRPPASPVGSVLSSTHSMNPWDGASSSILPGSEEGIGGRRALPRTSAPSTPARAGKDEWRRLCQRRQQPSLRRGGVAHRAGRRPGHDRPRLRQLALGHARLGRHAGVVRHQSDRRGLPASRRAAAFHRHVVVRDGARQGGAIPPWIPKPGSRARCCRPAAEGRDAGFGGRTTGTALTGAQMGFEASSFFVEEGDKPRIRERWRAPRPTGRGSRPCSPLCCRTKMCACRAIAGTILPTGQSSRAWKFLN